MIRNRQRAGSDLGFPARFIHGGRMPADNNGPMRPLDYNLALLAHLIYLARRSEHAQQRRYLDWASEIIEEMQHHPKLVP
jgi:hypothetical protein